MKMTNMTQSVLNFDMIGRNGGGTHNTDRHVFKKKKKKKKSNLLALQPLTNH